MAYFRSRNVLRVKHLVRWKMKLMHSDPYFFLSQEDSRHHFPRFLWICLYQISSSTDSESVVRTTLFLLHPCFPHQSIQHGLFFGCSFNLSMRALRVVRTSPCAPSVGQPALHLPFEQLSAASRANFGLFRRSTVGAFGLWAFCFHFCFSRANIINNCAILYFQTYLRLWIAL